MTVSYYRVPRQQSFGKTLLTCAIAFAGSVAPTVAQAEALAQRFQPFTKGATATVDHSAWDALLKTYVQQSDDGLNRIDYARFKTNGRPALKAYIDKVATTDVATLDKPEQLAFWANLYNAKTVDIVLEAYPVKSIKDISLGGSLAAAFTGGPWKAKVVTVGGVALSLDDIEHQILRPIFRDPRVHYAVNCASVGCPNLASKAFSGATLEAQLNAAARSYVNSPRGFRADGNSIVASSIYSWFVADFGGSADGVIKHATRFADPELKAALQKAAKIDSYAYDWSLNDIAR